MKKTIVSVLFIIFWLLFGLKGEHRLAVSFLDVGQGDAILLRTPAGHNILIDGGPDNNLLAELGEVLPWWERKIDYLVITHYHDDHFLGLIELLKKYKVGNILVTSHQPPDFNYQVWTEALHKHNLQPTVVEVGNKFIIDNDLVWQVLAADSEQKDYNANSLVLRLSYKEVDFLFMGDLPVAGEDKLRQGGFILESEILKVGHHGSKYSSSQDFLEAVRPKVCIIQSGHDNKFGHPHKETIVKLAKLGCQIKNTQNNGRITILTNGFSY